MQQQQDHKYQKQYCEENIWHLCQEEQFNDKECFIIFISNEIKCFPILYQSISDNPSKKLCFWDYHVILLTKDKDNKYLIWDLDTILLFPITLKEYIEKSFKLTNNYKIQAHPRFRIIKKHDFLSCFYSDRSHMLKKLENGELCNPLEYIAPPPSWEICSPKQYCKTNEYTIKDIKEYIDFTNNKDSISLLEFYNLCNN